MRPKFVAVVFVYGDLLAFEEDGSVWRFNPAEPSWTFLCMGPQR
jgi:hypothetical protein